MVLRLRRGVAEGVAVAIAFAIIAISMLYVLLNFTSLSLSQTPAPPPEYLNERLVLFLVNNTLNVKNVGTISVRVSYVIAIDATLFGRVVVNLDKGVNKCSASPQTIAPGGMSTVRCSPNLIPIAVITRNGRIFSLEPQFYALAIERSYGVPMRTVFGGLTFTTSSDLIRYLDDKSLMFSGAINASTPLVLIFNSTKRDASISANLNALLMFIGLNPANNRYNLLIIGEGVSGTNTVTVDGMTINLGSYPYRYRVKIENFTGSISRGTGIHPCYINNNAPCSITLSGRADRVAIYASNRTVTGTTGLDPYIFIGDLNNNGNTEVIFVTQDRSVGDRNVVNDAPQSGSARYIDYSVKPIRVVFSGTPINSLSYSSAVLSMRMFFWDNSKDDISDNDNRVVLRVGLYDPQNRSFIYSVELSYYELNRYRGVQPFSVSYISKDFTVYIPKTGRVYYVAVEFLDPYWVDGTRNDADLIIGIEYIGIALASR